MAVLRDAAKDRDFPLPGPKHLIGRGPDCDIRLDDPLVSARHARVTRNGDRFSIEDLASRNGTRVNGQRIDQSTTLFSGDRIEFGGHRVTFLEHESGPFSLVEQTTAGDSPLVKSFELSTEVRTEVATAVKLRAVLELSRNLSDTLKLNEVLTKILESLFAIFPQSDRGFVLLKEQNTGKLVPKAVRHRREPGDGASISRTVLDHAVQTGRAVLSADAGHDERFDASQSVRLHQIRSIMCVPLIGRTGTCLGVIQIDTKERGKPFTQDDLDVLVVAALQATRAVEVVKLHDELRELDAATRIQRSFLPDERPNVPGLRFFDHYAAAGQVGGDYFDYVRLSPDRLAIAIGDVAGKGMSAALLMARLSATARFCLATEPSLADAVRQVNVAIRRVCKEGMFITFVVGVLDLTDFTMTLVNAGHLPPLRRRSDGTVEEIGAAAAGIPLGVFERPYEEVVTRIEPGETIVFFSDGVTEAREPSGEMFGLDRLRTALRQAQGGAEAAGQTILARVQAFVLDRPPADDLTLVAFSRDS